MTDGQPTRWAHPRAGWLILLAILVAGIAIYQLTYDPECWRGSANDPVWDAACVDYDGPYGQP